MLHIINECEEIVNTNLQIYITNFKIDKASLLKHLDKANARYYYLWYGYYSFQGDD